MFLKGYLCTLVPTGLLFCLKWDDSDVDIGMTDFRARNILKCELFYDGNVKNETVNIKKKQYK